MDAATSEDTDKEFDEPIAHEKEESHMAKKSKKSSDSLDSDKSHSLDSEKSSEADSLDSDVSATSHI